MDLSVAETLKQGIQGLGVLSAIPVVLFALWADYYGRYLKGARKSSPHYDPKIERERVRVAAGCVLIFEVVLFVGSYSVVEKYPKTAAAAILVVVSAISMIRVALEKDLEPVALAPTPTDHKKNLASGTKALIFGVLSGVIYLGCLMAIVRAGIWSVKVLHLGPAWGATLIIVSAAAGILAGLAINFGLAPWAMKHSLPTRPMTEAEISGLKEPMVRADLENVDFVVIEDDHATAAIAGFHWGRSVFRPILFISRRALGSLSSGELTAVVAHESAHILARHLRKRVILSTGLILSLTFTAVFLTLATLVLFPHSGAQNSLGMFFGAIGFFLAFFVLQKQNRVHEFEADWIAVQKLGATFEDWASALRKMDQLNGVRSSGGAFGSHPATEMRIQNVAKMIEYFRLMETAKKNEAQHRKDDDRAA